MQIRIEDPVHRRPTRRKPAPFNARETLAALARPRLSTTPGHEEVVAEARWRFESLGYEALELPFSFAPWVGRFGLSIGAVIYLAGVLAAGILLLSNSPAAAAIVLVVTGSAIALLGANLFRLLHAARWRRRTGMNLLFHRPGARPRCILMAHLDSKSQLVPLSLRAPAIAVAAAAAVILFAQAVLSIVEPVSGPAVFPIALIAVLAGTILTLSWSDNDSPGALDNASGVATLLGVAERECDHDDIAFLITDAEELGLAGSRAVASRLQPVHGVINIDGIDDAGTFLVMERFGVRKHGAAPHLAASILTAANERGIPARRRDVPLGVLLDHMPLTNAGLPALTLMRGELRSLNRVHRPEDDLAHMNGAGVMLAVDLVCAALANLRERMPAAV
jgi:hypothetical protein